MAATNAHDAAEWNAISRRVRERAGWTCEACGVAQGAVGARDRHGAWHDEDAILSLNSDTGYALFDDFPDMVRIVLVVVHLDGDGDNHDDSNLRCLCQRCALSAVRPRSVDKAQGQRRLL